MLKERCESQAAKPPIQDGRSWRRWCTSCCKASLGCNSLGAVPAGVVLCQCQFMIAKAWRFCKCSGHMVPTSDVGFLAVLACISMSYGYNFQSWSSISRGSLIDLPCCDMGKHSDHLRSTYTHLTHLQSHRRDAENRIQLGPPRVFTHYQAMDL